MASSYVSSKVGRFGVLLVCVSVVVYCFSCSGVDIYRSSRVVVVICASSMSPSSSWYLRRRCVKVSDVSCSILVQWSAKCGGKGVRLFFVICKYCGAMFERRCCVMKSAWVFCVCRCVVSACS